MTSVSVVNIRGRDARDRRDIRREKPTKKNSASSYINTRVRYESITSAVHQIEQSTQLIVACVRNPNIYLYLYYLPT